MVPNCSFYHIARPIKGTCKGVQYNVSFKSIFFLFFPRQFSGTDGPKNKYDMDRVQRCKD